jgi:two-component system, NtrC family, sensor kinase
MEEKSYKKLRWKIVATTLSFSLIPLFALGLSLYYQFSVSYTAKIFETLRNLAENRRNAIDLFLDERVAQLYTLAYTHAFNQLKDEDYLNKVFTLMQTRSKSYVDLGIIDRDGYYASYVGPYELKGLNYKKEEWFQEVMLRGVYISDVFTGFRKFPHFIIAVMRREGDRNWILRATIDTEIFDSMVKAAQVGQKGDAFVLNKDSVLQTPPRFGGELLQPLDHFHISKFPGARVEEMTVKGENDLYAMTWLKNKDWLLVIKESPREELMPLLQARLLVIGLVLGGILLIVMGAVFITRGMVARLIAADREKATLDAGLMQSSKMAALGKLAAGIAHEVNNPLAVIKEKVGWLTDLLSEEDIGKSENFQEFDDALRKIDYHVDRARKVTHRLLGFARRMEPSQERVNINKILEETIDFLRNEAHYRNIKIHSDYALNLPETTSDSTQLQQVFLNILNNAIDAVAKDGVITIQTTHYPKDKKVGICITDEGPGIPSEILSKIFDPFFTTKEVGKGTGLGLAISYSIVEKLGGKIVVNSEVGKGTTFTILLPVVNQDQFSGSHPG